MSHYIHILPEIFFVTSLLILLLLGIALNYRVVNLLVLGCIAITLTILIVTMKNQELLLFNSLLKLNWYIRSMQGLILVVGIALLILLNLSKYKYQYEFAILIGFALLGMLVLVSANSLISLYLALELMNISLYVLACFNQDSSYSCEAGVKYFTLSAISSSIILYGMSLVYGYTGEINFSELSLFLQNNHLNYAIILGLIFIIFGLCFKLSMAPFHMWALDVYQGAPTIVTAFFSTAPKVTFVALLIRIIYEELVGVKNYVYPILLCVSVLSILISALGALRQQNLKRLLAYSSVGHMGHILAALFTYQQTSALTYLIIYIIINIGIFACLIQVDDDNCNIINLSGMSKSQPILAFNLSILLLSMAGLPPLAGFFTKLLIIKSLVDSGLIYISIIFVMVNVISCYYYLNIIKIMYFDQINKNSITCTRKWLSYIVMAASLLNIVLCLYMDKLYALCKMVYLL